MVDREQRLNDSLSDESIDLAIFYDQVILDKHGMIKARYRSWTDERIKAFVRNRSEEHERHYNHDTGATP